MDLEGWNFAENGLLPLRGEWELYWMELLSPEDFAQASFNTNPAIINLPNEITKVKVAGKRLPADGYATLRLRIKLADFEEVYGLKAKYLASASKIWVNNTLLSATGVIGTTSKAYTPQYIPIEAMFKSDVQEVDLIIQFANFHHRRVKLNDIYLGTVAQVQSYTYSGVIKDSILFGSLLIFALYHLIVFFLQKKDKAFIFFAVITFVIALRVGVLNERILMRIIPELPAEAITKIGYLPVFILLPLLLLYIREVFQTKALDNLVPISRYALIIFTSIIIFTPVKFYDWLFQYGLIFIFLCSGYVIYTMAAKGVFENKSGIYIMVLGGVLILLTALNDFMRDLYLLNLPEMLSSGVLLFILLQAFFLAWRFNESFIHVTWLAQENATMYQEIQQLNEQLELKIAERTKELEVANSRLEELSKLDPLTGIANRRFFDNRLQQEWSRSLREKLPLSMLMLDIDSFKPFNDNYGHLQGDECLRKITDDLARNLKRSTDFLARYGGEEFVILLPNTDSDGAMKVAGRLKKSIEALAIPHNFSAVSDSVTISLGVGTRVVSAGDSIEDFINQVDQALYFAKQKGRNQMYQVLDTDKRHSLSGR